MQAFVQVQPQYDVNMRGSVTYLAAGFFLGQKWSSVVADRHGHPPTQ